MAKRHAEALPSDDALRRELFSFGLYRVLEAALLALIFFGPQGTLFGEPRHDGLGQMVALVYAALSLVLLLWARDRNALRWQVLTGTAIDIVVAVLAIHAMPNAAAGIAMMLLFNIGASALLLPLRYGLTAALIAALLLIGELVWSAMKGEAVAGESATRGMFAVSYIAFALLTSLLGRRMRRDQALVVERGAAVADLAALNELIIRRMRTGVLLVDGGSQVRMVNEAALMLLGQSASQMREHALSVASPELAARLDAWRRDPATEEAPLILGEDQTEVLPRFTQLMASSHSTLIFLDDASVVSRRAESLTLAAMGRFSASLAHEIRNPLAAISYASQLLEESRDIQPADRRLLEIINQQCQRTNGIVESVLGLARRERANPEHIDLTHFVRRFVQEYTQTLPAENGSLQANVPAVPLAAMVDPRHLHQIITVLVTNALAHGRMPGDIPRVTVTAFMHDGAPAIDVLDRGPGIPAGVLAQLFRPFFTTSAHGTGLGLYIARELCRANQAELDYVGVAGGGGCFRIVLAGPNGLLSGG